MEPQQELRRRPGSGKAKSKEQQPLISARFLAAAVLLGLGAGLLLYIMLYSVAAPGPRSPTATFPAQTQQGLEQGDEWFVRAREIGKLPQEVIEEAPRLKPDHREVKTELVRINLRTLTLAEQPLESTAESAVPAELETGTAPAIPGERPGGEEAPAAMPVEPEREEAGPEAAPSQIPSSPPEPPKE